MLYRYVMNGFVIFFSVTYRYLMNRFVTYRSVMYRYVALAWDVLMVGPILLCWAKE